MEKYSVKRAGKTDIAHITELEKLCFVSPWSEKQIEDSFGENTIFYLLENTETGEKIGYLIYDTTVMYESELYRVGIAPKERGKGFSKMLMERMISDGKKIGKEKIFLEVRKENKEAVGLYKKYGFKIDGVRKNYYKLPKDDALLMSLDL